LAQRNDSSRAGFRPEEIGMSEIYKGLAGAPVEYDGACGVVVIWTKG
jgi:hypothetical protein